MTSKRVTFSSTATSADRGRVRLAESLLGASSAGASSAGASSAGVSSTGVVSSKRKPFQSFGEPEDDDDERSALQKDVREGEGEVVTKKRGGNVYNFNIMSSGNVFNF